MTRKDIVFKQIQHLETPVCPYVFDVEVDSGIEKALDDYYGDDAWRERYSNFIVKTPSMLDGRNVWQTGPDFRTDFFGTVWRMDLKPVHVETPALPEPSLAGYRFPDISRFATQDWKATVEAFAVENADRFIVVYTGFGLFERSWMLRGFQNALTDAALDTVFYGTLLEAIAEEHMLPLLEELIQLPVDGIYFGDDWGDQRGVMLGPDRWRQLIKPLQKKLYQKVKDAGKVVLNHVCGSIVDIVPDLIDIGLDVLESIQVEARGMDPYSLKKEYGSDLTFWGGLGSQFIIPFGTPSELRQEIMHLKEHMASGGGYILSCAKALQLRTPVENAAAILEEFCAAGEARWTD